MLCMRTVSSMSSTVLHAILFAAATQGRSKPSGRQYDRPLELLQSLRSKGYANGSDKPTTHTARMRARSSVRHSQIQLEQTVPNSATDPVSKGSDSLYFVAVSAANTANPEHNTASSWSEPSNVMNCGRKTSTAENVERRSLGQVVKVARQPCQPHGLGLLSCEVKHSCLSIDPLSHAATKTAYSSFTTKEVAEAQTASAQVLREMQQDPN